jgi:hypothetical protein
MISNWLDFTSSSPAVNTGLFRAGQAAKVRLHKSMRERHAIHVILRDGCGRYLAGQKDAWLFTEDFSQAKVFDFIRDRIGEQVEMLRQKHGLELSIVPVDPIERYEVCDFCGHRGMPYSTYFDGQHYFCHDCLALQASTAQVSPIDKS